MLKCTNKEIADAIVKRNGWMTYAANDLGISYQSLWHRVKKSEMLQKVLQETREVNLDRVEQKLTELVIDKNPAAIMFYLKCQGKHRGWKEKDDSEIVENLQETLNKIADRLPQ